MEGIQKTAVDGEIHGDGEEEEEEEAGHRLRLTRVHLVPTAAVMIGLGHLDFGLELWAVLLWVFSWGGVVLLVMLQLEGRGMMFMAMITLQVALDQLLLDIHSRLRVRVRGLDQQDEGDIACGSRDYTRCMYVGKREQRQKQKDHPSKQTRQNANRP